MKFTGDAKRVFEIFFELCKIPHGSGNTKAISDYCINFAKAKGLRCYQQDNNNVYIFKDAASGYENASPIIIQGHLDMVCVQEKDVNKDLEKEPVEAYVDGDFITAKGTSLGGDDGIALAYALATLESDEIEHPALEVVFTIDEETGMFGADELEADLLTGRHLINIDSEEEGIVLVGCAGGKGIDVKFEYSPVNFDGEACTVKIDGLKGGHSGAEIDKHRANSNKLAGELLKAVSDKMNVNLISFNGGEKHNAIANETTISFFYDGKKADVIRIIAEKNTDIQKRYAQVEDEINFEVRFNETAQYAIDLETTKKIISFVNEVPDGVVKMSEDIEGLVQTSLNMGVVQSNSECMTFSESIRSSVMSERDSLIELIEKMAEKYSASYEIYGAYPAWEYKSESVLRDIYSKTYKDVLGTEVSVQMIHAGLECGIFDSKLKGLDCISVGPDILDIHTPKERMSISSVERLWKVLKEVLRRLK